MFRSYCKSNLRDGSVGYSSDSNQDQRRNEKDLHFIVSDVGDVVVGVGAVVSLLPIPN